MTILAMLLILFIGFIIGFLCAAFCACAHVGEMDDEYRERLIDLAEREAELARVEGREN